uniref:Notch ligand N-terminal domain-containing protein n=1 Tax=Electrophorus electricus TaxID=8005 RepID=A0A4W4HIQ3_ELEEL
SHRHCRVLSWVPRRLLLNVRSLLCLIQVVRAVGSFELQIHQWQNSLGILQSGQCCDPQASRGQDCLLDDQCETFFRACLKEYQARVAPTGTCTFGIGSTPVLGGNSHTVRHRAHEGGEGGRIIIPFDYAWPVSISTDQTPC